MSDRAGLLKNAVYYAQPIRVTVSLEGCAAQLDIQVQDDGKGFNATDASMSLGPLSMREIARTVGYKVLIDSSLGNGTQTSLEYLREWRALRVAPPLFRQPKAFLAACKGFTDKTFPIPTFRESSISGRVLFLKRLTQPCPGT